MNKLPLLALVAALLIGAFSTPLDAEEKMRVAVMDLINKTEITGDEARSLSKQIRMVASATLPKGKFLIMTKDNIKSLLPPEKSLAQCTTAKCVIELGRMISADYIITGSIIHFAGQMRIDFGAHHSLSADSLGGRTADAGDLKGLEAQLKEKSTEVMGLIMSHAGVAMPARSGGGAVFVSPTQPTAPGGAAEVRALAPTEQPPSMATGPAGLYITSKPAGANVYLGQTKAGTTGPAFQKMNLKAGTKVRVTLKMNLYHDVSFDVALKSGVMKFEDVELKQAYGALKIESEPSGAEVFIGGSKVGSTPFSDRRYPSGQYLVTVKKEWYLPQEDMQITVSDGQATNKIYTLSQDFGTLEVESQPGGAQVTFDGKELGTTPGSWRVLPVTGGKLEVSLAKHRGKSFEISIGRDQTVKITAEQATLTAKVGSLQVYADPPEQGAKVFVDGKEIGTAPATVSDLIKGSHEVKVETEEKAGTVTVNITEGQTAVATVKLETKGGLKANGTIWIDSQSGLTWQVMPTGGRIRWNAAKTYCWGLNLGGYSNWRVPSISELRSLIRGCPATQKGGSCGVTNSCLNYKSCWEDACIGCSSHDGLVYWPPDLSGKDGWYWSSSLRTSGVAWYILFNSGRISSTNILNNAWVRCVTTGVERPVPTVKDVGSVYRDFVFKVPSYGGNRSFCDSPSDGKGNCVSMGRTVRKEDYGLHDSWSDKDLSRMAIEVRYRNGELSRRLINDPYKRGFFKGPFARIEENIRRMSHGKPPTKREIISAVIYDATIRTSSHTRDLIKTETQRCFTWYQKTRLLSDEELKGKVVYSDENKKKLEKIGFIVNKPQIIPNSEMLVTNWDYQVLKDYDLGSNHLGRIGRLSIGLINDGVVAMQIRRFKSSGDKYDVTDESCMIMNRSKYKEIMDGKH